MKSRVFVAFLSSYLIILFISVSLYAIGYQSTMNVIEEQLKKNNVAALQQNQMIIEQQLEYVLSFARNIRRDSRVVYYQNISEPFVGKNTYKTYEVCQGLKSYGSASSMSFDYAILYKNSEVVITNQSAWSIKDYFEIKYRFPEMDSSDWKSLLFDQYHINTILPSRNTQVTLRQTRKLIPCIYSLNDLNNNCALLVLLDAAKMNETLRNIDLSDGGSIVILDKQNNIITSTSDQSQISLQDTTITGGNGISTSIIDGKKVIVTYLVSQNAGWKYICIQPYDKIMSGLISVKTYCLLSVCAYVIIGLTISFLLSRRNAAPVLGIMRCIQRSPQTKTNKNPANPYGYIRHYIEQISEENDAYKSEMEKQRPLLIITFLERLLTNQYTSPEEVSIYSRYAGIILDGKKYAVALFSFEDLNHVKNEVTLQEMNIHKEAAINAVLASEFDQVYIHNLNHSRLAVIISLQQENSERNKAYIQTRLEAIIASVRSAYGAPLYVTVGGQCDNAIQISQSYAEALKIMDNHVWNGDSNAVLFYGDYSPEPAPQFSIEIKNALIRAIKAGDTETAGGILDSGLCLSMPHLGNVVRLKLYEIFALIQQTADEIILVDKTSDLSGIHSVRDAIQDMDLSVSLERLFVSAREGVFALCSYYYLKAGSKGNVTVEMVKKIVCEHYASNSLGLQQVADQLNISVSHLSRLFKDVTDENFISYVENFRVEKAKTLLKDTQLSINEIADAVGYSSANSFARAFKRINGITASEYRNI